MLIYYKNKPPVNVSNLLSVRKEYAYGHEKTKFIYFTFVGNDEMIWELDSFEECGKVYDMILDQYAVNLEEKLTEPKQPDVFETRTGRPRKG